jgi:hypothetical protein
MSSVVVNSRLEARGSKWGGTSNNIHMTQPSTSNKRNNRPNRPKRQAVVSSAFIRYRNRTIGLGVQSGPRSWPSFGSIRIPFARWGGLRPCWPRRILVCPCSLGLFEVHARGSGAGRPRPPPRRHRRGRASVVAPHHRSARGPTRWDRRVRPPSLAAWRRSSARFRSEPARSRLAAPPCWGQESALRSGPQSGPQPGARRRPGLDGLVVPRSVGR